MLETLKNLVKMKMEQEKLSLRKAGKQADVAHTTIDRVLRLQSIDLDTMEKICKWLGIPVSAVIDEEVKGSKRIQNIATMFSMNDEFERVFSEIAMKIDAGTLDHDIITEITSFASFRLHERTKSKH
jgi:transcriptional regulator with XRE-family HTH domain